MMESIIETIGYLALRLSLATGRNSDEILADIDAKLKAGDWQTAAPYWALNQHLPFVPSNGLKEQNHQGQKDAYDGFCSMAAGIYNAALNGCEDAMEWARFELLHLAWAGGNLATMHGEKERSQKTGAMTGALNAKPMEKYQRTSDVYWKHMRELDHDLNARTQTGIDIAKEEGRSKPLSAEAIRKRLDKLHQMT